MSIYLGQDKVGVSDLLNTNIYVPNRTVMSNEIYTPWTRPTGWPDLDSLNLSMSGQDSFIYMTFKTGHVDDVCSFYLTTVSGSATVSLGTISNGTFTATSTETKSSESNTTYWFTSSEGYSDGTIVVKVTGRLSRFWLIDVTRDNNAGGGTLKYYMQPMLERIWYVPELTVFSNDYSLRGNGTVTIQRDKVANGTGTALGNLYGAWYNCYNLQDLDVSGLNTPNITNLQNTFAHCHVLEHLDIAHFSTSKVTTMVSMCDYCYRLQELDLSTWNFSSITGTAIAYMFRSCNALKEVNGLENFYTNNCTSFNNTFSGCWSLRDLSGITNWNTSNVVYLTQLFYQCSSIKTLDLSKWNIGKVTSITYLFTQCYSLEYINFPKTQTATLTGSQTSVFYYCCNLQRLDLTWIKPLTSAVTSIYYWFCHCHSLTEINIPEGWDVSGCVNSDTFTRVFADCFKVQKITGISDWDLSNYNYTMSSMFENDYCLKELDISGWCPHPTTMYYAFYNCNSLEEIDLTGWNWENMTGTALYCTFYMCYSLKTIKGIEHMGDSGNHTSCNSTFSDCYSLTSLPNISSWNMAKVTTCVNMFSNCRSLRSLTISNWNLAACTAITNMFRYCYGMEELELTGWTLTALTTNPDYIFQYMYNLKKCSGLPIKLNHRYSSDISLPEDQWIRIFTQLPTVTSKTLYISTENINKLTDTTRAIATGKGWTLSN